MYKYNEGKERHKVKENEDGNVLNYATGPNEINKTLIKLIEDKFVSKTTVNDIWVQKDKTTKTAERLLLNGSHKASIKLKSHKSKLSLEPLVANK